MDKRFLSIMGSLVVIFVIIFAVTQHSNDKGSATNTTNAQPTNHVEGQGQKHVTLVEYGDYECPVCGEYYQPLKQVYAQFSSQIYFQFRNLPLTTIHKNAFSGARAAEAAGMQNKYWQMHDELYNNQDPTGQNGWVASNNPLTYFVTFAKQLGLNVNKFQSDYASSKVNNSINADLAAFGKTKLPEATPTFFLDGTYVDNASLADNTGPSVSKFAQIINAEIAKKNPQ